MNRLNVAITGMESYAHANYFPSWMEISVTLMLIAIGFAVFRLVVKNFPIFTPEETEPLNIPFKKQVNMKVLEKEKLAK
ncbi:MAG TPA: hypothetical protein ENL20_08420 [Candidatus Cloacimonetes bacterium]|nr:hypothetical protein [Candidatus Cloacimonadota bacterium]